MGRNFLTRPKWVKCRDQIYHRLVNRNRYAEYLDLNNWDGEDAANLQAFVLADVAETIIEETDMNKDEVIEMFQCFFESRFKVIKPRPPRKKEKIVWIWRGLEASKIQDNLIEKKLMNPKDRLTSHELGKVLSALAGKTKMIERRMRENRYLYLCNGYKHQIQDNSQ
jgi:hypothetical protein